MAEPAHVAKEDFDRAYQSLSTVFADIRGQVQFAEAKNGALFASTMALIIGIATVLGSMAEAPASILIWLGSTGLGLAAAALLALLSFLPVMGQKRHRHARGSDSEGENLIFWGEIRRFTPSAYAEAFLKAIQIEVRPTRLILDVAEQIVINSSIAHRKFRLFEAGAWATLTAMFVPTAILMTYLAFNGWTVPGVLPVSPIR
jgi:hypothetical protein